MNLAKHEICASLLRSGEYARWGNNPINRKTGAILDQMVADGLIVQTNRGVRVWRLTDKGREEITWEAIK
jgi:hypothetical protein